MSSTLPDQSVKVAIVGMTGSGKTVLISTLAMKMAQMSLEHIFMAPFGDNRRQTLRYTQSNWITLNEGQWPASTPAGELIELQWELTTQNHQALVQFLDCAGQDIRALFQTDNFNPHNLGDDLKRVYENISAANILIFLVNMKDLLATPDYVGELMDLDQMFHTLNQRNDIPRKMAVVFSQYDKYKPEVDQKFNGEFLEYLRHYIPLLHGQYIQKRSFEIIPVAAVYDTQKVVENGEVKQYPVPNFSSYNLEKLIHWIADGVEELAPAIYERNVIIAREQTPPVPSLSTRQIQSIISNILYFIVYFITKVAHSKILSKVVRYAKLFLVWGTLIFGGFSFTGFLVSLLSYVGYIMTDDGSILCALGCGLVGLITGFKTVKILYDKLRSKYPFLFK